VDCVSCWNYLFARRLEIYKNILVLVLADANYYIGRCLFMLFLSILVTVLEYDGLKSIGAGKYIYIYIFFLRKTLLKFYCFCLPFQLID
jgi:hypothetical protein